MAQGICEQSINLSLGWLGVAEPDTAKHVPAWNSWKVAIQENLVWNGLQWLSLAWLIIFQLDIAHRQAHRKLSLWWLGVAEPGIATTVVEPHVSTNNHFSHSPQAVASKHPTDAFKSEAHTYSLAGGGNKLLNLRWTALPWRSAKESKASRTSQALKRWSTIGMPQTHLLVMFGKLFWKTGCIYYNLKCSWKSNCN